MKTLLGLLAAICFCLVPVVSLAGNAHPTLYLEIYMLDYDPADSSAAPQYLCVHPNVPYEGEIPCYAPKAPYNFGIVPIHVGKLDFPISECWPLVCGPGGGYACVTFGISLTGTQCVFAGFTACANFLNGPSNAGNPAAIVVAATTKCHDWTDHPGYARYVSTNDLGASYFDIVNNADEDRVSVINCQAEPDLGTVIGGGAQWGGTKTVVCGMDPTAVETTTWGKIKGLYR